MKKPAAAIDIGTFSARLLIALDPGTCGEIRPMVRKRTVIRLAENFYTSSRGMIHPDAARRTVMALNDFSRVIKACDVRSTYAVATGLVRRAVNRDEFLAYIRQETGIHVEAVTGEQESELTARGVMHARSVFDEPFVIFDLGGGSTEFFFRGQGQKRVQSIPLGAAVLTEAYLKSDPPRKSQIRSLAMHMVQILMRLNSGFSGNDENLSVAGTGGTVTTLALMRHGDYLKDTTVENINGKGLKRQWIESLFEKLRFMKLEERMKLTGLDKDRAGIIIAGTLAVIKILHFLKVSRVTVSVSDLLEGILINHFKSIRTTS